MFNSKIASNIDLEQEISRVSLKQFLDPNRNNRSRLVWCHEADVATFESVAIGLQCQVHVDLEDLDQLRSLSSMDCLLVTEARLMRGVDYRNQGLGIDLLLARDFPTTRSFV